MKKLGILLLLLFSIAGAQSLDLVEGTVDGKHVCAVTLDEFGDMLGRPSVVETPAEVVADVLGPTLYYHPLGLRILFNPGEAGAQTTLGLTVHLTRHWDSDSAEWYSAFAGDIVPEVSAEWRVGRSLSEFAAYDPIDETPEFREEQLEEAGIPFAVGNLDHIVRVKLDTHDVTLTHEPTTRFFERVGILCE